MTTGLLPAIKEHLEKHLQNLPLPGQAEKGVDCINPPKVWVGNLPPKRQKHFDEIPCVVLVPTAGYQDNDGWATTSVALICLIYNNEEGDRIGAENDLMLLLSAITKALLPASQGAPLKEKYNLLSDGDQVLHWEKNDEQPRPFLQAVIFSKWQCKGWE